MKGLSFFLHVMGEIQERVSQENTALYDLASKFIVSLLPYSVGTSLHSAKGNETHTAREECQCHIVRACEGSYVIVEIWKIPYSLAITIHIHPTHKIHAVPPITPQRLILLWHPLGNPRPHYPNPVHVQMRLLGFSSLRLAPWKLFLTA